MIEILDTTLREGEQTPGVSFTNSQKIEIARQLDLLGIDFIEAGHPAVSKKIERDVKSICRLKLKARIIGHARAKKEDIDKVRDCGCVWVGIFMGINNLSLKHKYHLSKEKARDNFLNSLSYAKQQGLKVRCSIEDGSRTPVNDWISFAKEAEKAGADRISIVDTVGAMTPLKIFNFVSNVKRSINADLNVHCHDDFGMAAANSLAAYEAGVKCIDVTVNGLGERAGIASLSTVISALDVIYGIKKWDLSLLPGLSKLIERFSKVRIRERQPVIGKNVFTHKGGLHSSAVLENPEVYEILSPETLGRERKIILGDFSGKKIIKKYLERTNKKLSKGRLESLFEKIKRI